MNLLVIQRVGIKPYRPYYQTTKRVLDLTICLLMLPLLLPLALIIAILIRLDSSGPAQVRGRSAILFDEIVQYDIEYFERRSLKLDLQIMWWTFASVVLGRGAR